MGAPLAIFGTALSFKASMDQAKAMEYQAQATRQTAEYNATIQKQNAQQEEAVLNYKKGVEERKKRDTLRELSRALEKIDDKGAYEASKLRNKGAYQGADFDFVLESSMQDIFAQQTDAIFKGTKLQSQYESQASEYVRQALFARQSGQTKANLTIMAGNNKANDLENAAGTARLNALGDLAVGIGEYTD